MRRSGYYHYYEESGFQAVRLPYQGDRVGRGIFLPSKKSGLPGFLRTLTSAKRGIGCGFSLKQKAWLASRALSSSTASNLFLF